MKSWGIVLAAWITIVAGGGFAIKLVTGEPNQYVTTRAMRLNHRLIEGDVAEAGPGHRFLIPDVGTRAEFVGRYLPRAYTKSEAIALDKTQDGPNINPSRPTHAIAWLSLHELSPAQTLTLDVQDELQLCTLEDKPACGAVTVLTIACKANEASTCAAAVDLTPHQRRHLLAALGTSGQGPKTKIHVLTHHFGAPR